MGRMNTMKWAVYFLSFWGDGVSPVPVEGAQDGVLVHQVSHDLLWSKDPSSDTVVNHLGFTVSIELAIWCTTLCNWFRVERTSVRVIVCGPLTAVAGHGDDNDASVSSVPVVEAIHARAPHALGTVRSVRIPIVVCITSSDQPRHPLKDCSVRWWTVRCTFRHLSTKNQSRVPFEWSSELAYGALRALPSIVPLVPLISA